MLALFVRFLQRAITAWPLALWAAGALAQVNVTAFQEIRQKNQDSVVFIHSTRSKKDGTGIPDQSYGTGFIISRQGSAAYVLTASHVVQKDDTETVVSTEGSIRSRHNPKYPMELVKRDEDLDIALLLLPESGIAWQPVTFGDSAKVPDDAPLYALGFPGSSDLSPAPGILSNRFGPHGQWQTTLPINRGHSGGPVFDLTGKVVAIADAGSDEYQAITFVIPAAYVVGLRQLAAAMLSSTLVSAPGPSAVSPAPAIVQTFAFYKAVDHQQQQEEAQEYCLPEGYIVSDAQDRVTTQNGPGTRVLSFETEPTKRNCALLRTFIEGAGVDRIGPIIVNYRGRGWLGADVTLQGKHVE